MQSSARPNLGHGDLGYVESKLFEYEKFQFAWTLTLRLGSDHKFYFVASNSATSVPRGLWSLRHMRSALPGYEMRLPLLMLECEKHSGPKQNLHRCGSSRSLITSTGGIGGEETLREGQHDRVESTSLTYDRQAQQILLRTHSGLFPLHYYCSGLILAQSFPHWFGTQPRECATSKTC